MHLDSVEAKCKMTELMELSRPDFVKFLWDSWSKDQACNLSSDKSTQYDTEEIVKLRRLLSHLPQTIGYGDSRVQLRRDVYNKLIEGDFKRERKAVVLCGLPASRKSTIADVIQKKLDARIVDSDLAKEKLPEFNQGRFAQMVHQESDLIRNDVIDECMARGENLIIPIVGKSHQSVLELFEELTQWNYEVHLRFLECDPKTSAERAVKRFADTGRFVDPKYVLDIGSKADDVFNSLKSIAWASRMKLSQVDLEGYDAGEF